MCNSSLGSFSQCMSWLFLEVCSSAAINKNVKTNIIIFKAYKSIIVPADQSILEKYVYEPSPLIALVSVHDKLPSR